MRDLDHLCVHGREIACPECVDDARAERLARETEREVSVERASHYARLALDAYEALRADDEKRCEWTADMDGIHYTTCGNTFQFTHDHPYDYVKFCCYCGARVALDVAAEVTP